MTFIAMPSRRYSEANADQPRVVESAHVQHPRKIIAGGFVALGRFTVQEVLKEARAGTPQPAQTWIHR
jgi:hypothetical protein